MVGVVMHCEKESTGVFATLDTEMIPAAFWYQEGLDVMCSKEDVWREACEMERSMTSNKPIDNDMEREEKYKDFVREST